MNFKFDGVVDMKIWEVNENKKQFIALLLLADEQEKMFNHYLEIEYGKKSIWNWIHTLYDYWNFISFLIQQTGSWLSTDNQKYHS